MSGGSSPSDSGGGGGGGGGGGEEAAPGPAPPGSATRQDNDNVKKIVIFSKITALHVHQSILYISLTITARLRRETSSCHVFWGRGHTMINFPFSF